MINKIGQRLSMALVNQQKLSGFFEPLIQMFLSSYSANKHRAKVIRINDENKRVFTLVLKPSSQWKGFNAGQFIELIIEQNGVQMMRIFSISSAPCLFKSKGIIELSIQKQEKGRLTGWLHNTLNTGQLVNISAAKGDFTLEEGHQEPILLIAAGTGITPFRSILNQYKNTSNIHLIYYAKNSQHLFTQELKELEQQSSSTSVAFINSDESGRICQQHLEKYCPDFTERNHYICGPSEMIQTTQQLLLDNNIEDEHINFEYFGAKPISNVNIDTEGKVSFIKSALQVNSNNTNKQTLLELAESSDLKPMTGCRMGICHQCKCEKKQGVVYNTLTKVFSDTGAEEVQLCVSIPVGDVSINL